MRYMFTIMNNGRLSVGLEGVSLAERAYPIAVDYAKERKQGRAPGAPAGEQSAIVDHPAVRRLLLTMRSSLAALRAAISENAPAIEPTNPRPPAGARAAGPGTAAMRSDKRARGKEGGQTGRTRGETMSHK